MATQIKQTVLDVLTLISDLRGETTVNTNASRIRAVAKADEDFALRKFWSFYLLPDQSMAGNDTEYYTLGSTTYPMREKGLTEVRVGGTSDAYHYDIVNEQTYRETIASDGTAKVCYQYFDAVNDLWKVRINGSPETTDTIYYSYYWQPATQTLTTDYVITPDAKIQALLALSDIYFAEGEYTLSDNLKVEAEQLIDEAYGRDTTPAVNQTLTMPVYGSGGIGTY